MRERNRGGVARARGCTVALGSLDRVSVTPGTGRTTHDHHASHAGRFDRSTTRDSTRCPAASGCDPGEDRDTRNGRHQDGEHARRDARHRRRRRVPPEAVAGDRCVPVGAGAGGRQAHDDPTERAHLPEANPTRLRRRRPSVRRAPMTGQPSCLPVACRLRRCRRRDAQNQKPAQSVART